MKENTARDRAELKTTATIFRGHSNDFVDIEAVSDGLCIDEFEVISWDWIDAARAAIKNDTCASRKQSDGLAHDSPAPQ